MIVTAEYVCRVMDAAPSECIAFKTNLGQAIMFNIVFIYLN